MAWRPTKESNKLLLESQRLLNEYSGSITLRQLFYLLADEKLIKLDEPAYRKIKNLMINARKHGRVPPTTFAELPETTPDTVYADAETYIKACLENYRIPRTLNQPNHIEIWVEREPLRVFINSLVKEYDIPVYVTGGYSSFSFVFDAARRLKEASERSGSPRVLYFSDFSPASTNMFESQLSELSTHLDLSREEMDAIMLRVCVEPEHILKFDLPVLETLPPSSKTLLFESLYSDRLELYGLPRIPVVEIESLNPFDLADLVSNVLFSLTDQDELGSVAVLEDKNRSKLEEIIGEVVE